MYYEAIMTRFDLDDQGKAKKITERFLLDALSITEAVTRFESEISALYPDHDTKAVRRTGYSEVITDESADDRYFHATYNTYIPDEKGKEKKTAVSILIQADSIDDAKRKYDEIEKSYCTDIELVKIAETKIIEYFPAKLAQ